MAIFLLLGKNEFCVRVQFLPIRVATGLWAAVTDSNSCDVAGPRTYAFVPDSNSCDVAGPRTYAFVPDSNSCDVAGPRTYAFRVSRAAIYTVVRRVAQTYQTNLVFRHPSVLAPPL